MSTSTHSIEDLRQPSNERFHTIDWAVQRLFWVVMILLLAAGLLGFLGQGPVVWQIAVADDRSLAMEYYTIERYASPTQLIIRLRELPKSNGLVELRFTRNFATHTSPVSITPEPLHQRLEGLDLVYVFRVDELSEADIIYRYQHQDAGRLAYEVSLPGRAAVAVSQFVLP